MTAVHQDRGVRRVRAYEPPPVNWSMVGVIMAVLVHLGAAIWFAAGVDRRVSFIEVQLPPGAIQRLDDRTVQIQRAIERLEARS